MHVTLSSAAVIIPVMHPPFTEMSLAQQLDHVQKRIDSNPFSKLLQFRAVSLWPDGAELEMPITGQVMQMLGLVHGGALATLVDSATACAIWPRLEAEGLKAVTLELKINFLASPKGAFCRSRAELIRYGRSTAYLEAGVSDEAGKLCCRASATYFILRVETPA